MTRRPRRHRLSGLFTILMAGAPLPGHGATSEAQGWITTSLTARASESDLVSMDISQRFRSDTSGDEQMLVRVGIDHRIADGVQIGGGIAYLEGAGEKELRPFQQIILSRGPWLARTRLEQRFFDNDATAGWRLRQRVQAAMPIDAARRWTAVVAGEAMAHLNRARPGDRTGLATIRAQIGLRHAVTAKIDAQLLYMYQVQRRSGRPDATAHIPWLTLAWRI